MSTSTADTPEFTFVPLPPHPQSHPSLQPSLSNTLASPPRPAPSDLPPARRLPSTDPLPPQRQNPSAPPMIQNSTAEAAAAAAAATTATLTSENNHSATHHQNILRSTCIDMNFDHPSPANNISTITNNPPPSQGSPPATAPTTTYSKIIDKQSMEYVIRSSIAGGLAGTSAKTLIAPLDRVKILFQTSNPEFRKFTGSWLGFYRAGREIYRTQGFFGLFQGHSATLLRIFPYAATKFVMYEQVRALLIPDSSHETSIRRFLAGSISGVTSVFVTYPLDLVRVRLAFETRSVAPDPHPAFKKHRSHYDYKGGRLIQAIQKIYNEPAAFSSPSITPSSSAYTTPLPVRVFTGLSNFYRGFTPTILGMIPYAGVSFWAHDLLHDVFRSAYLAPYAVMDVLPPEEDQHINPRKTYKAHRQPLTTWAQLTAGGLAGMMAQTASYPLEVVRRRIQVSGVTGESVALFKTITAIYHHAGIQGFFVGLSIGYIKVVPMFACSFFVYERLKSLLRI